MTYQGTFRKGVVVLEGGAILPEGTPVTVTAAEPPTAAAPQGPKAGSAKGKVHISSDFDDPLFDFDDYTQ